MKTRALRLHGARDLRIDEYELPPIKENEILAKVVSDSLCMSSYKLAILGQEHKRVRGDLSAQPTVLGHELAGDIVEVGKAHQDQFRPGMKFTLQPALNYKGTMWSPGYSYEHFGGNATYIIIPSEVMALGYLLEYKGKAYYEASLAEPMSCSIGAFRAAYHTRMGSYEHQMGIREGGRMAILAGAGPMGLGAITYALNADRRPGVVVITDIDEQRLARARALFPVEEALEKGVALHFVNMKENGNSANSLIGLAGGKFDDVMVYAPVKAVLEMASDILGQDGCLNFFAGPTDNRFKAELNYYDVHYASTHVMGTTGGNLDDMKESLNLTASGRINPAVMVTHIGGLEAAKEATLRLPELAGGKKLIYTHLSIPLIAIEDFPAYGESDPRFAALAEICSKHNMLWNPAAEQYLLSHF